MTLIFAFSWILLAVYFGQRGSDPAFTIGAIICANIWLAHYKPSPVTKRSRADRRSPSEQHPTNQ